MFDPTKKQNPVTPAFLLCACMQKVLRIGRRIDALFDIERDINGNSAAERQEKSKPLLAEIEERQRQERVCRDPPR